MAKSDSEIGRDVADMTVGDILQFFADKGFTITITSHRGEIVTDFRGSFPCAFGSGGATVEDAIRKGYAHGVASFGTFTREEIVKYYHDSYERATGKSHLETFGW